ncbi:hypothetical protein [Kineococcus rhizosphaerae]|uniref:Uncharacterized protein n=1 Tax=Kineococcus rhizosphaerae TaxID=559628 RepID=A0A2T0QYQ6_9ACTN|nr:hypothetical protein [Kineococcus rhizosphaerae]PRY11507.1 hypothetical protein CLV37_113131 [Kineococcus rhizosphaerae]
MADLREDLVRAAGDVSGAPALVASATVLGRRRLRRRRHAVRGAAAAGVAVAVVAVAWVGSGRPPAGPRVVPAQPPSVSSSIAPQRQAAETLDAAVDETLPGWSTTPTALAGRSVDERSLQDGWFTVRRGDVDPVEVRLTVQASAQEATGSDVLDCHDCHVATQQDGSQLGTGRSTRYVSSNEAGGSTVERRWAQLLTTDHRLITAEATPVADPDEPLPAGVTFPVGSPVTEDALAALVRVPALQQLDLPR